MPEQEIEEIKLLMNYPGAEGWMWSYCTYLGPFTDSKGDKYDLGVRVDEHLGTSLAIVYSNECGDYISGSLEDIENRVGGSHGDEAVIETVWRWEECQRKMG